MRDGRLPPRKVGAAVVVLVAASMLVFVGVRAIPGDPAIALGAESRDPALIAQIRHKYLLDRPLPVQYVHWVWLALHGDLGVDQRELPVAHTIVTRIPITLELALLSIARRGARRHPGGGDRRGPARQAGATTSRRRVRSSASARAALLARPALMIIWFAVDLHWLPASGLRVAAPSASRTSSTW